ncbi:MAG: GTP-binding protein [bacterium]|nr:GTP-binding protein [bacterium]
MDRLRTFGIVAHIDAGKTTLTERILYDSGAQSWVGSVDEGTSAMDWMPLERSRGISITAAATRVTWNGKMLQVVDTPGHVDFVAEVERCLHVLDGVVVIVDGVRSVQSQTETVWRQAEARALPALVFVNKLDRVGADFPAVLADLAERFECSPAAVVVPLLDRDGAFAGLGHAVTGAVQWFEGEPEPELLPELRRQLVVANDRLVEIAADLDEDVMALVVAGEAVPREQLVAVLRRGAVTRQFVPVLAGAALWNRGVDWLLDAVVDLLPSPSDVEPRGIWSVERAGDPGAPACGLVFKVQHDTETWNFVRLVRGRLVPGEACVCVRTGAELTIPELWLMHGDRHRAAALVGPGEIVVVPGDLGLRTGDTVAAVGNALALPVPRFPTPVLSVAFEPEHGDHGPELLAALRDLAGDDPTLRVDLRHGEVAVRGMGELNLEIVAEVVRSRVDFAFELGRPRVARRETVSKSGAAALEARALVLGEQRGVRCEVRIGPRADGVAVGEDGYPPSLAESQVDGPVAEYALAALRARIASGLQVGPLVGVTIELVAAGVEGGGAAAGVEAYEALAAEAADRALAAAAEQAGHVELEPWVQFEVTCPEEGGAAVLADLGSRGADVSSVVSGRLGARVVGRAPLAAMLGYVTRLRSITKGRGQAWLRPAGFARVTESGGVG